MDAWQPALLVLLVLHLRESLLAQPGVYITQNTYTETYTHTHTHTYIYIYIYTHTYVCPSHALIRITPMIPTTYTQISIRGVRVRVTRVFPG